MSGFVQSVFGSIQGDLRRETLGLYGLLAVFNTVVWGWAFVAFSGYPLLMGTSLLAYSLGLRHAVDADHIAAIDNATRKLMQAGEEPTTVGLMFSLGHSTIVVLASAGIAVTVLAMQSHLSYFSEIGGLIGTVASVVFLFVIGLINFAILRSMIGSFRRMRRGEPYVEDDFDSLLAGQGLLVRVFRPLFSLVKKSWHMYFVGFLFGLGFDTATEVGLLGISAAGAAQGMSIWSILIFPALFTAGMALVDTVDNTFMLAAYRWAYINPVRKIYYNITITAISVGVALLVGAIECLALVADRLKLSGLFWDQVNSLADNFAMMGYGLVALFVLSWLLSVLIYRWKRLGEFEVHGGAADVVSNM